MEEAEWQRLRTRLLVHSLSPEQIPKFLESIDSKRSEDDLGEIPPWAEELSDEEMEDYQPITGEEADETIRLLRKFGVAAS